MTVGEKLLCSIIRDSNIRCFLEVPKKHFDNKDELKLFHFVERYYRDFKDLPTAEVINDKFGYEPTTGKVDYYRKELTNRFIYTSLAESVPKKLRSLKADPQGVLDQLRDIVSNLELSHFQSDDLGYFTSIAERYADYEERSETGGVTYLSTGSPFLDKLTYGYRKNDLWTFGGRSGTKKTWFLIRAAIQCEKSLPEEYGPILVVSNEIGLEEFGERFDAIRFRLNYGRLQEGNLTGREEKRYRKGGVDGKKLSDRIILIFNCSALEELMLKVKIYQPSIVFLDGSYLLEPEMEEGMAKTTYITRNLKQIAKDMYVPIINTTQLRKKSGKKESRDFLSGQDEFFYGSYVHDSDLAMRTFITPEMLYYDQVGIEFVKTRRMKEVALLWTADLEKMEFKYDLLKGSKFDGAPEEVAESETDIDMDKLGTHEKK